MAFSQMIWSLDEKEPLQPSSLTCEAELEDLLSEHMELLNSDWLVVGRQVLTDAGKIIDLLCMDQSGHLIVVELKKNMTPREVTAQVIDYASSATKFTSSFVADVYLDYAKKYLHCEQSRDAAFAQKYGMKLDEDSFNQENVKMVIVASSMDSSTERIVNYLHHTYLVDINILFFRVFDFCGKRLISRAWFTEDAEESPTPVGSTGKWNGEYYVSFGVGNNELRQWEDAREYGFISAGGGAWYSSTLRMLKTGDRVWVNIPHVGYVGVGIVEEPSMIASDIRFLVDGKENTLAELPLQGKYLEHAENPEKAEYLVKVRWVKTVPMSEAVRETGFFGNQNTVCRPQVDKWDFTIKRLKVRWHIDD